jgi:hypothetical protein
MKRSRAILIGAVALALCVPAAFAVADLGQTSEDERNSWSHEDPDPSTDGRELLDNLDQAHAEGNSEAEDEAAEALRAEIQSRMTPEDPAAANTGPREADVPPGTIGFIAEDVPDVIVEGCEHRLKKSQEDNFCELLILNAEGKVRSGPYTQEQIDAALEEAR